MFTFYQTRLLRLFPKYGLKISAFLFFFVYIFLKIVTVDNTLATIFIAILEISILVLFLFRKDVHSFLFFLTFICGSSFEMMEFVSEESIAVYSALRLPFFGAKPLYLMIFLQLLIVLIKDPKLYWVKTCKKNFPKLFILLITFTSVFVFAILFGLFSIITSEYNLRSWFFQYFKKDILDLGVQNTLVILFVYGTISKSNFHLKLREALLSFFSALIFCSLHFFISGKYGNYSGQTITLFPLSGVFLIFFFVFPFSKHSRKKVILGLISALALFFNIFIIPPTSGRGWLFLMSCPILLLYLLWRKKSYITIAIVVFFSITFLQIFNLNHKDLSNLSKDKLYQAKMLASLLFSPKNFSKIYDFLPLSPKIRIEEVLNIFVDYYKNPQWAFFGKGFGGTIKDHRNSFGSFIEDAFPDDQYANGRFAKMHSVFARILLPYGIFGSLMFISITFIIAKNLHKSPWLLFGLVWLIFFYGYSITIALLGIPTLVIGFFELDLLSLQSFRFIALKNYEEN